MDRFGPAARVGDRDQRVGQDHARGRAGPTAGRSSHRAGRHAPRPGLGRAGPEAVPRRCGGRRRRRRLGGRRRLPAQARHHGAGGGRHADLARPAAARVDAAHDPPLRAPGAAPHPALERQPRDAAGPVLGPRVAARLVGHAAPRIPALAAGAVRVARVGGQADRCACAPPDPCGSGWRPFPDDPSDDPARAPSGPAAPAAHPPAARPGSAGPGTARAAARRAPTASATRPARSAHPPAAARSARARPAPARSVISSLTPSPPRPWRRSGPATAAPRSAGRP